MRHPPPIQQAGRYVVTTSLAAAALAATLLYWRGNDVSMLYSDVHLWRRPWEFFTSTLLHGDMLHLLFNIYWLWVFGTIAEETFGHWKTALFYVTVGVLSSAAQHAFTHPGIGLSGVGYGLFGLLWVLSRRDRRCADVVDNHTIQLFVVWFFLCIVLTAAGVWRIGNVAHGVGALLGIGLGFIVVERGGRRLAALAGWAGFAAGVLVLSSVARPYVNFSPELVAWETADDAYASLTRGDTQRSIALFEQALARWPNEPNWWYNLGVGLAQENKWAQAADAFDRAAAMKPEDSAYAKAAKDARDHVNELLKNWVMPSD